VLDFLGGAGGSQARDPLNDIQLQSIFLMFHYVFCFCIEIEISWCKANNKSAGRKYSLLKNLVEFFENKRLDKITTLDCESFKIERSQQEVSKVIETRYP